MGLLEILRPNETEYGTFSHGHAYRVSWPLRMSITAMTQFSSGDFPKDDDVAFRNTIRLRLIINPRPDGGGGGCG